MGWVWGLKMRMGLEESQDLLNTQETGCSNDFPLPWKLLLYHRSPTLPDKMISFSITCKELKLSCRYWHMESFSFFYCLRHDASALGLRLYMWVSPCWHGCSLPSLISFSPLGVLWEHHQAAGPLGQAGLGRGIEEMGGGWGGGHGPHQGALGSTAELSRLHGHKGHSWMCLQVIMWQSWVLRNCTVRLGIALEAKESLQTKIRWVGRPGRPTGEVKASRGLHWRWLVS